MPRQRDPRTNQLLPEGVRAIVSERTGVVRYRARYTTGTGRQRRFHSRMFDDAGPAEAWLLSQRLDVTQGRHLEPSTITVADYYVRWYERRARQWTQARARIVDSVWRNHIEPAIGGVRLQRVTRPMVQDIVDAMERAGRKRRTVDSHMSVPRLLFADAMREGLVHANPAVGLIYARGASPERVVWTPLQMRAFLHVTRYDRLAPLWAMLVGTGCRVGEALALQWSDIDLDAGTVHIHRTLTLDTSSHYTVRTGTKTNERGRVVPIDPWLVDQLRALPRQGSYVFQRDGDFHHPSTVRRQFRDAVERAGLPMIRIHDIRHSVASAMVADGVSIKVIQEILGHENIATTLNTYAHVDTPTKRQGVTAMSRLLGMNEQHDNTDAKTAPDSSFVSESVSESRRNG